MRDASGTGCAPRFICLGANRKGTSVLIGYLNIPLDQLSAGLAEAQSALFAVGATRLFVDIDTGHGLTPQLDLAIGELREGDALVTFSVQTLTRSIDGLMDINRVTASRGASLRVLRLPGGLTLDTATSESRAIMGALALMSGLPVAGQVSQHSMRGSMPGTSDLTPQRNRGRPATAGSRASEVNRLRAEGLRAVDIAATLGIGRASVYRILSQEQDDGTSDPGEGRQTATAAAITAGRFDPFSDR